MKVRMIPEYRDLGAMIMAPQSPSSEILTPVQMNVFLTTKASPFPDLKIYRSSGDASTATPPSFCTKLTYAERVAIPNSDQLRPVSGMTFGMIRHCNPEEDALRFIFEGRATNAKGKVSILSSAGGIVAGGPAGTGPASYYARRYGGAAVLDLDRPRGDGSNTWAHLDRIRKIDLGIQRYPWPASTVIFPATWAKFTGQEAIQALSMRPGLSDEDVRDFITLSFLQKFDEIMDEADKELKKKLKKKQRMALIKSAIVGVFGLAASFLLPAVLGSITSGLLSQMDTLTQQKAADSVARLAAQLSEMKPLQDEFLRYANKLSAQTAARSFQDEKSIPDEPEGRILVAQTGARTGWLLGGAALLALGVYWFYSRK